MGRIKMTKGLVRCNKCRRLTDETVDGQCGYCKEDELDQTLNSIKEEIDPIIDELISIECDIDIAAWYVQDQATYPEYEDMVKWYKRIANQRAKLFKIINKHRRD